MIKCPSCGKRSYVGDTCNSCGSDLYGEVPEVKEVEAVNAIQAAWYKSRDWKGWSVVSIITIFLSVIAIIAALVIIPQWSNKSAEGITFTDQQVAILVMAKNMCLDGMHTQFMEDHKGDRPSNIQAASMDEVCGDGVRQRAEEGRLNEALGIDE